MRYRDLWLPALLLGLLCGCATEQEFRQDRVRLSHRPLPQGGVVIDVVLLERPLGDPYIHSELWSCTDEHIVGLEQKQTVANNGFRVGQLVGLAPSKLQALLANERVCVQRERLFLPAGGSKTIQLGPVLPQCEFQVPRQGEPIVVRLELAQCGFVLSPSLTNDGRTRLRFTPIVQYGQSVPQLRPVPDLATWELQHERLQKTYVELGWDAVLAPNTFLLVGTTLDEPSSLGYQAFAANGERVQKQRLLLLRTTRALGETEAQNPRDDSATGGATVPPLALQASMASAKVRGTSGRR